MKTKERAAEKYSDNQIPNTWTEQGDYYNDSDINQAFIEGVEWAKAQFQWMQEHNKDLNAFDCMSLGEEEE